jgi:hypothetical protein
MCLVYVSYAYEPVEPRDRPGVLSARNHLQTAVLLELYNLGDRLLLQGLQLIRLSPAGSYIVSLLDKLLRSQKRADMLGAERWGSLEGRRHLGLQIVMLEKRIESDESCPSSKLGAPQVYPE